MPNNNYILTSSGSFVSEDELYHHGIKGMKWGVRRYQNEDGTLTAAGRKRLGKMDTYRTKLANKAKKRSERAASNAKEARRNIADLKKNGTKSEAYRKWKESEDYSRELDWRNYPGNKITDSNGNTYYKDYYTSAERFVNDGFDFLKSDRQVKSLIETNIKEAKEYSERSKKWLKTNENLMNMDITALTKKKDIRKTYWS